MIVTIVRSKSHFDLLYDCLVIASTIIMGVEPNVDLSFPLIHRTEYFYHKFKNNAT